MGYNKPRHGRQTLGQKASLGTRKAVYRGTAAAVVSGGVLAAGVPAAFAATPAAYTQNGSYQFASDTFDYNGTAGSYVVTGSPQSHSDSSEALGADGVDLAVKPGTSGYADAGVIVNLGRLSTLFGSTGTYVGPKITGSSNLGVNFYFGTNGSTSEFGTLNSSGELTGADGDNYASVGVGGTAADFTTFGSYAGTDTAFTAAKGSVTMADLKAAYAAAFGTEGVKTADPEVWAWIGISGATAETGYVTSVDGTDLVSTAVTTPPPAAAPYVYGGHDITVDATRATVGWSESAATGPWDESANPPSGGKCEEVWISGPGFGAWNPADPTNPGTSHVGFTCDHGTGNTNTGYLAGLRPGSTYALRVVPATGTYGHHQPIPGANVGYVDVFTAR